jgi:hypothetical protein
MADELRRRWPSGEGTRGFDRVNPDQICVSGIDAHVRYYCFEYPPSHSRGQQSRREAPRARRTGTA